MQKRILAFLLPLITSSLFAQTDSYPINTSVAPPPVGLYATVEDYLALHPSDTSIIFEHTAQIEGEGINNFYQQQEDGKKGERILPKFVFAASDGKTFYIAYNRGWHKAQRNDSGYTFVSIADHNVPEARVHFYDRSASGITDYGKIMADNQLYRMRYSITELKWIIMERAGRRRK